MEWFYWAIILLITLVSGFAAGYFVGWDRGWRRKTEEYISWISDFQRRPIEPRDDVQRISSEHGQRKPRVSEAHMSQPRTQWNRNR